MFRLTLILILLGISVSSATWPDCIVAQVDDTGDDLVSGLRFSDEQCANWCKKVRNLFSRQNLRHFGGLFTKHSVYCAAGSRPPSAGICQQKI